MGNHYLWCNFQIRKNYYIMKKINLTLAASIVAEMNEHFDSHDFIRKLNETSPDIYIRYIVRHCKNGGSINTADGEIALFLSRNKRKLHIDKDNPEIKLSTNILGNISRNAAWIKQDTQKNSIDNYSLT